TLPVAALALPLLAVVAMLVRATGSRTGVDRTGRPRLLFGPTPILSFTYLSRAMRAAGYEALTLVDDRYHIHAKDDFDRDRDGFFGGRAPAGPLRWLDRLFGDYLVFGWILVRFDIVHTFFDGAFLHRTPLRFWEAQLLHLAGRRLIVMPYGSDVAVPSLIRSLEWRNGLMQNYPAIGRSEPQTLRQLEYFSRYADYVVACLVHLETMPRWDLLTIHYYPIDTEQWTSPAGASDRDGRNGPVSIVHAPNHRALKGTDALVRACDVLRQEGLQVDLRLLEGIPNTAVRAAMAEADILAEQFILGYGLTAMEGMSLGKPVLSNLTEPAYYDLFRARTRFSGCPIISTDPAGLVDTLRGLVTDPAARARIGEAGRAWVAQEHSYAAMAALWEAIYRRVWWSEPVEPADLLAPSR
ncbi:MAG: glycosyltransferase family 4 protein, partial [Chloroflexota bacterium]